MKLKGIVAVVTGILMLGPLSIVTSSVLPSSKLPAPTVDRDSWVMIEIRPDVQDITLSAYFLDLSYEKNKNLCNRTKQVFDSERNARAKAQKKKFFSYRICVSGSDAVWQGYIQDS